MSLAIHHKAVPRSSRVIQALEWSPLYSVLSCEDQFATFNTVMSDLINDLLPNVHPCTWITDVFRDLINQR